ncbi:MAG: GNAT family N-acetyltransferase [Pseudomonadales bacterium]
MVAKDAQQRWAYIRSIKLFRPYRDAVPWDLFETLPAPVPIEQFEEQVNVAVENADDYYLRVAKQEEVVVGAYLMRRGAGDAFYLDYLAVISEHRNRGLGSWLTGHAIGIAESKGGRQLRVGDRTLRRFFARYGFTDDAGEQQFVFIQE